MKKSLSLFALMVALSGCTLFNPYEKPATEMPKTWAVGPQAIDAAVPTDWWQGFDQPELTQLIDQALHHNFDLDAAVARMKEADAQARISGASLLPTLDATADATRSKNGSGGRSGTVTTTGTGTGTGTTVVGNSGGSVSNSLSTRLNASYEVDFWGRNLSSYQSALSLASASRYDEQTVRLTVAADVATTYFTILELQERVAIANKNLADSEGLLEAINRRSSVGLASGLDVAQQENIVATQRATLPALTQQLTQQLDTLAILVGTLPENITVPAATALDTIAVPAVAPGLPSTLMTRRPDVANAEAQLIAAHADINNARAAFFPVLNLTTDGGFASNALNSLFKSGNFAWSLGAGLTQPIFEGGSLLGQLAYSHARYDELLANYKKSVASAFADVEDALAATSGTAALEVAQQEAVRSAQVSDELSRRQFDNGIIDITTVLNTQRSLLTAQDALAQARAGHLQAVVGLYQALGGGFDTANNSK